MAKHPPPERFKLTKGMAEKIIAEVPQTVTYYGEIQGIIHALYKESQPPKLVVRELATHALVDCFFKDEMYQKVVNALRKPDTVLFIEGTATEEQEKGQVGSIEVARLTPAPDFDEARYKRFIGSQPGYTGTLTTEEFIAAVRDDG